MNFIRKISKFYIMFIKPKKVWHQPKKIQVLVYDRMGSENFVPYLKNYDYSIFDVRGESINITCLFRCLFKVSFWSKSAFECYIETYISLASPKALITFIDNDFRFWKISKKSLGVKTFFVQNGLRGTMGDVFGFIQPSEDYRVDYMFVFGELIGKKFTEYISGKVVASGSFKNNMFLATEKFSNDTVLFISQWRPRPSQDAIFVEEEGKSASWEEYFLAEQKILTYLDTWCFERNKKLIIAGAKIHETDREKSFYSNFLQKCDWIFLPRNGNSGIYEYINDAEMVVCIDSTAGLESIARGKRTAIFCCREVFTNIFSRRFGWPGNYPVEGLFWTNSIEEDNVRKIMEYISGVDQNSFLEITEKYSQELMAYDYNNSQFVSSLYSTVISRPIRM